MGPTRQVRELTHACLGDLQLFDLDVEGLDVIPQNYRLIEKALTMICRVASAGTYENWVMT